MTLPSLIVSHPATADEPAREWYRGFNAARDRMSQLGILNERIWTRRPLLTSTASGVSFDGIGEYEQAKRLYGGEGNIWRVDIYANLEWLEEQAAKINPPSH